MPQNSEETNKKIINLVENLLSQDDAKHLSTNVTDLYVGYVKSDFADCKENRSSKTNTFLIVREFFDGLTKIQNA